MGMSFCQGEDSVLEIIRIVQRLPATVVPVLCLRQRGFNLETSFTPAFSAQVFRAGSLAFLFVPINVVPIKFESLTGAAA